MMGFCDDATFCMLSVEVSLHVDTWDKTAHNYAITHK